MRKLISYTRIPMFAAFLAALLLFSALSGGVETSSPEAQSIKASWKATTPKQLWQDMEPIPVLKNKDGMVDVEIDLAVLMQEIDGFGGTFNEKGWVALSLLTPEEREAVLKEFFDPRKARNSISAVYQSVPAIMRSAGIRIMKPKMIMR